MRTVTEPTFTAEIYIAGNMQDIERRCAEYCMEIGLCVSIEPVKFVYTGGREDGAVIRLVNYPRFPSTPDQIRQKANILAEMLIRACSQWSALVVDREQTLWLTYRQDSSND